MGSRLGWSTTAMFSSGRSPSSARLTPYSESDSLRFARASMPYRDEFPCLLCWCHAELWFLVGICAPEAMTENLTQGFILAETSCAAEFALLVDFCSGWHTLSTIAIW